MAPSTSASPIIDADCLSSLINHVQLTLNRFSAQFFEGQGHGFPDERNRQVIQSAEVALVDSLSALSGSLADLSAASESLASLQGQVQYSLARTRALTSPVRRLPMELLQLIFHFVHQVECPYRAVYSSPPAVSQVSRLWRQISLDTSCFWTGIKLHLNPEKFSSQLERVLLWIERSANRPVTLTITDKTVPRSSATSKSMERMWNKAGTALARALEPYGGSIGALHLNIESHTVMLALLSAWHQSESFSMPSLKLLECRGVHSTNLTSWSPFKDFLREKATGVVTLALVPYPCDSSACRHFTIPPPGLKVFRGRLDAVTFPVLVACQDLEILEIRDFEDWDQIHGHPFSPLTRLTSLHLIACDFRGAAESLPPLPALQHLIISHEDDDEEEDYQIDLVPMLRAWGAKLKYLCIHVDMEYTSIQHLQACLSLAPELEALRFASYADPRLIEIVQTSKLPLLTHCEFHFDNLSELVGRRLEDFTRNAKREYLINLSTLRITYSSAKTAPEDRKTLMMHAAELSQVDVMTTFERNTFRILFDGPYFERIGGLFTSNLYLLS